MRSFSILIVCALVIVCALIASSANAQRVVTLEDCMRTAHEQSPLLLQAKRNYQAALSNAEATSRGLRSTVDLNLDAPIYSDNSQLIFNPATGTTDLYKQNSSYYGGGLTVHQPIFWTGGSINVSGKLLRRNQLDVSGTAANDYFGVGTIAINQPIFKANEYKLTQRESDLNLDLASADYASRWASLNYTIQSFFYSLYQAEQQLNIQRDEVAANQANYDLASNKFKAGLIAEVDALQLEVDLASAKTDLFDRERQLLVAQRNLLSVLGMPLDGKISAKLDTLAEIDVDINASQAISEALRNREDVMTARYGIDRGEIAMDRIGNDRTINASLSGNFGATHAVQDISLLSQHPDLNKGLSLEITVPLFDWGTQSLRLDAAESNIEASKVTLSLKEQQVEQEVRSTIEQIEASKKQIEVAKKSVDVARKAYDLSHARFDAGKITSQDLTLAQQRLTKARLSALNAQVAEHLALADLTQKTLYDFVAKRPVQTDTTR